MIYVQPQQVGFESLQRQDLASSGGEGTDDASDGTKPTIYEGRKFGLAVGLCMALINLFALRPDLFDERNFDLIRSEFLYLLAVFAALRHFA